MSGTCNNDNVRQLAALEMFKSEDAARDDILNTFVRLTSQMLNMPGCVVSLLDHEQRQIHTETPSGSARPELCQNFPHPAPAGDDLLLCPDIRHDARFSQHRPLPGAAEVRFYAAVPLRTRDGTAVGTLCITDARPQCLTAEKVALLHTLAGLIGGYLDAWYTSGYLDVVTGLPNRQRLLNDMTLLQQSDDATPCRLTLIDCIDMPRAYEIARSVGMSAVEVLLKVLAAIVRQRLQLDERDVLYTVATGRFALLLRDGVISGRELSDRLGGIRARLQENITIDVTPYVGEVRFIPATANMTEVLRQAVSALHEAIERRQAFFAYDADSDSRKNRCFQRLHDLASALRGTPGLYLVYQPQLCLHSNKTVGLEALLRWDHPLFGHIPPCEFIGQAKHTSLMDELTDWVIDRILTQLRQWRAKGILLPVSVNLSVNDFSRPGFANRLEEKTLRAGLQPDDLSIECLETEQVLENPQARQGLDLLKLRGFRIALDDFGSGYSNINTLRRIPIDVIKLDRSLIQQLNRDPASAVIVRHIITMLKELEYVVLAEGVEDVKTLETLQRLGCDEIQGYYYSRPLPPAELEQWLSDARR